MVLNKRKELKDHLREAKDCNKATEEMDNFLRQKNYRGSGSIST
jgi:hypothetical protein